MTSPTAAHVRTLRTIIARHPAKVTAAVAASIVTETLEMSVPIIFGFAVDRGILGGDLTLLLQLAALAVLVRLVAMAAWSFSFHWAMQLRMAEQHNLRVALTAAALHPGSRPVDRPAGEVLSIATSDADNAPDFFDMIGWALPAAIAVLGAGAWMAFVSPWLGLAVLIGILLEIVGLRVVTPVLSRKYDDQQSRAADAASTATDLVHGLRVLQGLGVQHRARLNYRASSRVALRAALTNARFSGVANGMMILVSTLMIASVVVLAASLTLSGAITVGALIAVVSLIRTMSGMMHGLSGVPVWWASISTSAKRIDRLMADFGRTHEDPVIREAIAASPAVGEAAPVTRGNGPRRDGVGPLALELPDGRIEVADGEVVGVVAPTARDAHTVLTALAGTAGDASASLGGEAITPGTLQERRRDLLIEPHTVDLFDGTLREQLATRAPEKSVDHLDDGDAWARSALEAAGALDLLGILSDGFDTRIQDRGSNLSGGQRQRLALARAVAADPPALVLHDPTTAVDAVTEQNIGEALAAARRVPDRLTLILTRAPSLLVQADRVVFLAPTGAVSGTHFDLMERDDYAEVVKR